VAEVKAAEPSTKRRRSGKQPAPEAAGAEAAPHKVPFYLRRQRELVRLDSGPASGRAKTR
jgi:hypothetical protein